MNRIVSVAPMMDCTDRHERYFLRLISKNTLLYTEMIVDEAINRGDKKKLLEFNINEKPVALQIGGSSPKLLAEASKIGEDFGYDEINLNLGCPSKKVEKNKFGACLMKEPNLVADCVSKMQASTKLPVTIKTRIGYDNVEDYENFYNFISVLKSTGIKKKDMSKINVTDPVSRYYNAKVGDIFKIIRASVTSGYSTHYRLVKNSSLFNDK